MWSADAERAKGVARKIRTGQIEVNGGAFNPNAPFGGYKQSGYGREYGTHGFEEFLETKSMQLLARRRGGSRAALRRPLPPACRCAEPSIWFCSAGAVRRPAGGH